MFLWTKMGQNSGNKRLQTILEIFIGFVLGFCVAFVWVSRIDSVQLKPVRNTQKVDLCGVRTDDQAAQAMPRGYLNRDIQNTGGTAGEVQARDDSPFLQLSKEIHSIVDKAGVKLNTDEKTVLDRLSALQLRLEKLTNVTDVTSAQPLKSTPEASRVAAEDEKLHQDDRSVADNLYRKVRVLCWVMTQPANLETRARHVKNTWGRRCHKLLFFSSQANETFPTIALNGTYEDRSQLNKKTLAAFQHVHEHYGQDYDWYMRTDDDAYVIMENLRYFLSEQDPNGTYYFGHHFKTLVPGGYFSGGPGIVLGREALRRYAYASRDPKLCFQGDSFADDAELGNCLHQVGIIPGNSTDRLGRSRFHCFDPGTHLMKFYPDWFYAYDANGAHGGRESMSDYAIGFHYVNDVKINELEYYVYHLRPYGVKFADQNLNWKLKR